MGYPLQAGAPQFVVSGVTYAIGAFEFPNPIGQFYKLGVFRSDPIQGWIEMYSVAPYSSLDALFADLQAKGGVVNFCTWAKTQINAFLGAHFSSAPSGDPTTGPEAAAAVTTAVNGFNVTVTSGIPIIN